MKLTKFGILIFAALFWSVTPLIAQEESEDLMDMSLEELLEIKLDYGYKEAPVSIHAYMNTALWNFGDQFWGKYANVGGSAAGRPLFISYSGYISVSAQITSKLFAEAEFELYKGQKGEFKVTRLRQVWTPSQYFRLTLGRDFPAIGVQDKIYYPTSQFRLITIAPYTYLSILRATGWWDSGIHMTGKIPLRDMKLIIDMSIINGPGDQHQSADYLLNHMKPNVQGYMYESFHDKARQPWDNNKSKHIAARLSFLPIKDLSFGGSYMFGKYDDDDKYNADFLYAHLLYGGERLTVAAEYGQLAVDVNPTFYTAGDTTANGLPKWDNTLSGTLNADKVTQYSYYISAGYKFFPHSSIEYFEPVFRYEFMDSWKEDKQDKGDRNLFWLGFRFSPIKHWVIKAAYSIQTESYEDLDNDGFVIESVIDF
jgi:hypothetical protein